MKNIIILVLSIVLMASCASSNRLTTRIRYANRDSKHRFYGSDKHYDVHYSSSPEGKRDREQVFYVVDTIKIADPLIISEKGNMFVLSQSAYENNSKSIKKLYRETDVYIVCVDESDFYDFLSSKHKARYRTFHEQFYSETESVTIKGKQCYKFKSPDVSFVLGLIKVSFFNVRMTQSCGDWYRLYNREYMNSYYRIVFPILKKN